MLRPFALEIRCGPTRFMISVKRTGWSGDCIEPISSPATSTCQNCTSPNEASAAITMPIASAIATDIRSTLGRSSLSASMPPIGPVSIGAKRAAVNAATANSELVSSNASQPSTTVCAQNPLKKKVLLSQRFRKARSRSGDSADESPHRVNGCT